MKNTLPKLSKAIEQKNVFVHLDENYNQFSHELHQIMYKWLSNSYSIFKDHQKYLILIFLVKKTFDYYSANYVKLNWDQFFELKQIELGAYSIINISKELKISRETTRRKILELQKENIIKKTRSGLVVQTKFFNDKFKKDNADLLKLICSFVNKFSIMLNQYKIVKDNISSELVEKSIIKNFSYAWKIFFEMLIPSVVGWKTLFGDIETWHIWCICTTNKTYEINKNLKDNNIKSFVNPVSPFKKNIGINAMSISNLSSIPRATVIRKLNQLTRKKFLNVDSKKLYYSILYNDNVEIKTIKQQNKLVTQRLSIFLNKILNLAISSK